MARGRFAVITDDEPEARTTFMGAWRATARHGRENKMIKHFIRVVAVAAAAGLMPLAIPAVASADPFQNEAVENCQAKHPGAVDYDEVTDGDDIVCTVDLVQPSAGNDTYIWVIDPDRNLCNAGDSVLCPTDAKTVMEDARAGRDSDPGEDILSMEEWTKPYVETNTADLYSPYGMSPLVREFIEKVVYTPFNDRVIGQNLSTFNERGCPGNGNSGYAIETGAGDDTILCLEGEIDTGEGDDYVATYTAPAPDEIVAGEGEDIINVVGGGTDTVTPDVAPLAARLTTSASTSGDTVCADSSDRIKGTARVITPTVAKTVTKPFTITKPVKTTKRVKVWHKGHWKRVKKVWNKKHTRKVWKKRWVKGHHTYKTVTVTKQTRVTQHRKVTVRVPAGPTYTGPTPAACAVPAGRIG